MMKSAHSQNRPPKAIAADAMSIQPFQPSAWSRRYAKPTIPADAIDRAITKLIVRRTDPMRPNMRQRRLFAYMDKSETKTLPANDTP